MKKKNYDEKEIIGKIYNLSKCISLPCVDHWIMIQIF